MGGGAGVTIKQDDLGATIKIDPLTDLIRVDGIIICRRIERDGQIVLQFKDGDRIRSRCRGTCFVEVPLEAYCEALTKVA